MSANEAQQVIDFASHLHDKEKAQAIVASVASETDIAA